MKNDHEFDKKLAIIQIKATIASTLGTILVSLGVAILIFGYTIAPSPSNLDSSGHNYYVYGLIMVSSGIGLLIGSFSKKVGEIRKL